jgi:hypothetical protein
MMRHAGLYAPAWAALAGPLATCVLLAVALGPALDGRGPLGDGGRITAAEAVLLRDYGFLERFVAGGGSLSAPARVRAGLLTGQDVSLTPLQAAVVVGYDELFDYVWARSRESDAAALDDLLCLARRSDREALAARLAAVAGEADCARARYPW